MDPYCLRKLYQTTEAGIGAKLALLAVQAMERQPEQEQMRMGW